MGTTVSAASKIVDGLAERGFVRRDTSTDDRRKLMLELTESGEQTVDEVHEQASSYLAQRLGMLSPGECAMLNLAMDLLRGALVSGQPASR
jgi:DNA-binding MarR family transcriptional regulator